MLVVVRHAHAVASTPGGDDLERELSPRGAQTALALRRDLLAYHPEHLLSSPARRCRETLEPLAQALGRPLTLDEGLGPRATDEQLALVLAYVCGLEGSVVAATHAPQLERLVATLLGEHGITIDPHALHLPPGGYVTVAFSEDLRPARIERVRAVPGPSAEGVVLVG